MTCTHRNRRLIWQPPGDPPNYVIACADCQVHTQGASSGLAAHIQWIKDRRAEVAPAYRRTYTLKMIDECADAATLMTGQHPV